jgi:all-trans-retinol 13,14-reductase
MSHFAKTANEEALIPELPARLRGIEDAYDVVVIGSGLAGLTGAHALAKAGYKVLVLEQHYQIGGLATWFKRKGGHIFDISLHGFPIGMIKSCRRYWSDEIADSIIQLKELRFENPQFSVSTSYDRQDFSQLLVDTFRVEPAQVDSFFKAVSDPDRFTNSPLSTGELIESYFPGRNDIKRLLLEPIAYANGSSEEDPALVYSIVFSNFMKKGIYTFRGGTDQLVEKMVRLLEARGVTLCRRVGVERILCEKRPGDAVPHVTGVIAHGKTIRCKAVLSNSNLKQTLFGLIGSETIGNPSFLNEAEQVRLNSSSCQVYLGIRKGTSIPHVGDLLFVSDEPSFSSDALKANNTTSRTFSFYYPETRPHLKEPRYTIVASSNANWDDWKDLDPEAYQARKSSLIESTLDVLERFLPGVRGKIDHIEAATPRTIHHFTQHLSGASFGTKYEGLAVSRKLPEVIHGAYHAGSVGIIMSGWLGTINYGQMTAVRMETYLSALKQ